MKNWQRQSDGNRRKNKKNNHRHSLPMVVFALMDFLLFAALAIINLCKAAFAGFTETVVQIDAGFVHGAADHIIADVTGAGEEVA